MPRGAKPAKKPAAKRPTRKAKAEEKVVPLRELEDFLVELYNWPDVTDILAADSFKEALDQFSNVAEFRAQLKENLAPCYVKRRMPRTPKKLAHKAPPCPIPQTTRVIDFELDANSDVSGNSAVIAVTGMVPQTPVSKLHGPSSNFKAAKNSGGKPQTQSPFNRLCNVNPVIASTPTSDRIVSGANVSKSNMMQSTIGFNQSPLYLSARGAVTMPASASRPILRPQYAHQNSNSKIFPVQSTPNQPVQNNEKLKELQQKLDDAGKRHEEYLQEQKERVARDNDQRKRRVEQNRQAKEHEIEQKREEHRLQQERIRQFEDAQRSPKTPLKAVTPGKFQTPGQKAVPQKRAKQNSPVQHYIVTPKPVPKSIPKPAFVVKPTYIPVPKPRPAVVVQPPKPASPDVTIEKTIEEVVEIREEVIVVDEEEEVIHCEEVSTTVEMIEEQQDVSADKENQAAPEPVTPVVKKQIKQDESAYEMTPDKVFQPSTENDYNVNDLSSGDETDNEENPRKKVPRWAEKGTLRTNVQNLFRFVSKDTVNAHFGALKPPKITTLFANNNKNYDSLHNETTSWDSPIANPRSAPLTAKQRNAKH